MINWMNLNQGFVMSILTMVYVVATIIIVIMNSKSIKEMKETRLAESRPYIIANLVKDPRDKCFYLRVKNYGKTGAVIDCFEINPEINLVEKQEKSQILEGCLLAPQQALQFIVLEEWEKTCAHEYQVYLSYYSIEAEKREFTDNYVLATQYAHQMGYTDKKGINLSKTENALVNISEHLDSIRNKI